MSLVDMLIMITKRIHKSLKNLRNKLRKQKEIKGIIILNKIHRLIINKILPQIVPMFTLAKILSLYCLSQIIVFITLKVHRKFIKLKLFNI